MFAGAFVFVSIAVPSDASLPLPSAAAPIGIFDSGLGGLSVARAIRAALPHETLIYCADSRHAPYGPRSDAFIVARSLAVGQWLRAQGAKALVVACNTATAHAITALRDTFAVPPGLPVIGVEPGIKPAAAQSARRVVGVLATAATLRSHRFQRLLAAHGGDCRFICQAGHGLVEHIERGDTASPAVFALLRQYLIPMLDAGADTLVLGCTHYPFLAPAIRGLAGDRLTLIDTGEAIARQLVRQLDTHHRRQTLAGDGTIRLCATAQAGTLARVARQWLGWTQGAETVDVGLVAGTG